MECTTPSRWSTCSRTVSAKAARSSADVTSRRTTGAGLGSLRAISSVSCSWRPKEVRTTSAPSCWARRATSKAMDDSVSTPVTRIFLPSSRAMVSPFGGRRWRLRGTTPVPRGDASGRWGATPWTLGTQCTERSCQVSQSHRGA